MYDPLAAFASAETHKSRQASTSAATTLSGKVPGRAILLTKYMLQSGTFKRTIY
jgi:hypothetical protein